MKVTVEKSPAPVVENVAVAAVHPLHKSHTLISTSGHVNYDKLTAFEAISMTAVFVLAIGYGVLVANGVSA